MRQFVIASIMFGILILTTPLVLWAIDCGVLAPAQLCSGCSNSTLVCACIDMGGGAKACAEEVVGNHCNNYPHSWSPEDCDQLRGLGDCHYIYSACDYCLLQRFCNGTNGQLHGPCSSAPDCTPSSYSGWGGPCGSGGCPSPWCFTKFWASLMNC